jgi:DNA-directed RNA polymerase specialized sigma24 family protein
MALEPLRDLYRLAYLLTGDRERSVQAVIETLDAEGSANPFFDGWFVTWARKIFIAKVLGPVPPEASLPELRTRLNELHSVAERTGRGIDAKTGVAEMEAALLAIDVFPRRALLLRVFEKLSLEDVGILLNAGREAVKVATSIGLIELSRNLAASSADHAGGMSMAASMAAMTQTGGWLC